MKHLLLVFFFFGSIITGLAQKTEKVVLDKTFSSEEGYLAVFPENPPTGFLILVGSYGETAEEVLRNSSIPAEASKRGILTIVPIFQMGTASIGFDQATQESFRRIADHAIEKHQLHKIPFFVGGFSIGGTAAVKFAELAVQNGHSKKPNAVFAVDPPLDFERLYYSAKRNIRLSKESAPPKESQFLVLRLEDEFGGSPDKLLENYTAASPYSFSDTTQTAIKNLIHTPIRIYIEPDVDFFMSKGIDLSGTNALDASAFVNELQRLGNNGAELLVTKEKGFREPGHQKNPHSWSIVDAPDLVQWLLQHP